MFVTDYALQLKLQQIAYNTIFNPSIDLLFLVFLKVKIVYCLLHIRTLNRFLLIVVWSCISQASLVKLPLRSFSGLQYMGRLYKKRKRKKIPRSRYLRLA